MKVSVSLPTAESMGIAEREWLWREWIPAGALTILAGEPGAGKSTITAAIAAAISAGALLPDGSPVKQGRVVIYNSEDQIVETINPRLIAAGANLKMVNYATQTKIEGVVRGFDPSADMPILRGMINNVKLTENPVRLVVIDPLLSAVTGSGARAVREGMEQLKKLAEETGCAVLGVHHFSKGSSKKPLAERVTGSLSYVAVARMVLAASFSKQTGSYALMRVKSNVSGTDGYYPYDFGQVSISHGAGAILASRVAWADYEEGDLPTSDDEMNGGSLDAASEFLSAALAQGGRAMREVQTEAQFHSFSERTLRRAKDRLGVLSKKVGGSWFWCLPQGTPNMAIQEGQA